MHAARRLGSLERHLGNAALFIGRGVARGASLLPRLVRRASGLEAPSPEATVAAVVRGVTALAPKTIGGVGGVGLELAGAGAVLALATWTLYAESDADTQPTLLDAIAAAERRELCSRRTALLWRALVGVARRDEVLVTREATALTMMAARSVSLESMGLELGQSIVERLVFADGVPRTLRAGLHGLALGRTFGNAWVAMGEAARLVDGMRAFGAEHATLDESAVVIRLPSRAA